MAKPHPSPLRVLAALLAALLSLAVPLARGAEFNFEVEKRVLDVLRAFMSRSVETNVFLSNYRSSGAFPSLLAAPDRDAYLVLNNYLSMPLIYYGLEDGTISGFYKQGETSNGYYREPGNSGYDVEDESMAIHYRSCVNAEDGSPTNCDMVEGEQYVRCIDGCALRPCPNEDSQADCSPHGSLFEPDAEAVRACEAKKKYCPQYEIVDVEPNATRGYVPITNFCHDIHGRFTQEPGKAVRGYVPSTTDFVAEVLPDGTASSIESSLQLKDCTYGNGIPMERSLSGPYARCGGTSCDDTFAGGFESSSYDPRYRPWYIETKRRQKPTFFDPFPFYDLGLGVVRTHPIYDDVDRKRVFAGVLSIDYRFETIASFLEKSYGDAQTATMVAIYEDAEPNYLIAVSTGTPASSLVMSSDKTKPCPVNKGTASIVPCEPLRTTMEGLKGSPGDELLVQAFRAQREAGYPKDLVTAKASDSAADSNIYVTQSALYEEVEGEAPRWRVIVASRGDNSTRDSIEPGNPLFGVVFGVGALGFLLCSAFLYRFYSKRSERAVRFADLHFTSAFIAAAAGLNLTTFALVGPNTDALCLTRAWTFHLMYAATLSPLLVKTYRMWRLVGRTSVVRETISHARAALWCAIPIGVQAALLIVVSAADPPRSTEWVEMDGGVVTRHVVCDADTPLSQILIYSYEMLLMAAGCVLAFKTRKLNEMFGESKQLIFSMYTITVVFVAFFIVGAVADFDSNSKKLLQVIGVLWATVFSSAAYVVPRMDQIQEQAREGQRRSVRVSGINLGSTMGQTAISRLDSAGTDGGHSVVRRSSIEEESKATQAANGTAKDIATSDSV